MTDAGLLKKYEDFVKSVQSTVYKDVSDTEADTVKTWWSRLLKQKRSRSNTGVTGGKRFQSNTGVTGVNGGMRSRSNAGVTGVNGRKRSRSNTGVTGVSGVISGMRVIAKTGQNISFVDNTLERKTTTRVTGIKDIDKLRKEPSTDFDMKQADPGKVNDGARNSNITRVNVDQM